MSDEGQVEVQSKSSKAPSQPYHLFNQMWVECEDGKTRAPSKSGKSKKCKASKVSIPTIVETDAKDETVEVVYFEPPAQTHVRQQH